MARVYRINILEDLLKRLTKKVGDIRQSVIVSNDGFVVAAYPGGNEGREGSVNSPQVAAMAATLVALGDQTLERLAKGNIKRLLIEGDDGAIIVYPINRHSALACLVTETAKMGLTLREIARSAAQLADIL